MTDRIDYASQFALKGTVVRHPRDPGVWLADAAALDDLPAEVTAVVSLCLVGRAQVRPDIEHIAYRIIDHADPEVNPNLDFALVDAARTIATLSDDGHGVLLHCVAAQNRTPAVAVAYSLLRGVPLERALAEVVSRLPAAAPNPGFRAALDRIAAVRAQAQIGCVSHLEDQTVGGEGLMLGRLHEDDVPAGVLGGTDRRSPIRAEDPNRRTSR